MGKAGVAGKPKGRTSAYAYFVKTCRDEHRTKYPNENVVFSEFSKKCADEWKTMSDGEKKRFHAMAEKDKKRHEKEMASYSPPANEKGGKKKRMAKDPNAPKRALSAFFWFCNDERPKVKASMGESTVTEVAKELGRRWNSCTEDMKAKYVALAAKDKARYEKAMSSYKGGAGPAKAQAKEESDDDDDEEEEDYDDDD